MSISDKSLFGFQWTVHGLPGGPGRRAQPHVTRACTFASGLALTPRQPVAEVTVLDSRTLLSRVL